MDTEKKSENTDPSPPNKSGSKLVLYLKRIGIAGFLFFLIKGILWLALFYFFGVKGFEEFRKVFS